MWLRNPKFLALALAIALIGAACGGDDTPSTTTTPAPTQAPTAVSAAPTAAPGSVISTPSPASTSVPGATAAPTAVVVSAPQPAMLEVRVTDAPPDGVTKILLTVENIEVNIAEGVVGGGWETIVEGPVTFDLVAVTGIEEVLGDAELPPGRYNQIRLKVTEALVTIDGQEKTAKLPSGSLRVVGGFDVVDGETTVLTLDFDAARSVVLRGKQDPILKPVVKLLVRRSGQPMSAAETAFEPAGSGRPLVAGESVVTIGPSKDNTLYLSGDKNLSNGAGMGLFVGKTIREELRRGLVAFDLTDAVPAGATITDVLLRLTVSKTQVGDHPVGLHRVEADWGEGASDANANEGGGTGAEPGDVTWFYRFFETDTWATPGGDFVEDASATTIVGFGGDIFWVDSDGLVADVQGWVDDPSSNFGWVVIGDEKNESRTTKRFETKESGDGANGPALTITFTMPSAPAPTPAPAPTATPTPAPAPTATPVPTATVAPAAGNSDSAGVQDRVEVVREIRVTLLEFSITPNNIQIQAGEKVRFTVTNVGSIFHTFTFDLGGQLVSVELSAGETGTTEILTFTAPATNPFWCVPHQAIDMVGTISVSGVGSAGSGGTTTTASAEDSDDGY